MQVGKRISWPLTCSCTAVCALTWPFYVPVWASTRSLLSRRANIGLPGYFVMMMARVGLHSGNITWYLMTHVTLTQSVDGDGHTFIIIIHRRQETASKQQQSVAGDGRLWVSSLTLTEILLPSSPRRQYIHSEVERISKYDLRRVKKCQFSRYSDQHKKSRW